MAAQKEGLLPLTQHALIVLPRLSYHDYEGVAVDLSERERLVRELGPHATLMILRNHGTLALGRTAGECWTNMFYLERACRMQVLALSAGRENVLISPAPARREINNQPRAVGGSFAWPGASALGAREPGLRRLSRVSLSPRRR